MTEHIHKYMRVKLSETYTVFKCMIPGCPHYICRELVIGRQSICWKCEEPMILTMRSTTLKKPHHLGCTREVSSGTGNI